MDHSGGSQNLAFDPKFVEQVKDGLLPQEELARREQQQKKHYEYCSRLQALARELPLQYQQRLPYELLNSLAQALLDGTVFDIVLGLREMQHLEEKNLYSKRAKLLQDQKAGRREMEARHEDLLRGCIAKPHNKPLVQPQIAREKEAEERRYREELQQYDVRTVRELDQKAAEQQTTLQQAGVPGFYVTTSPQDVKLQMYLLELIAKISRQENS